MGSGPQLLAVAKPVSIDILFIAERIAVQHYCGQVYQADQWQQAGELIIPKIGTRQIDGMLNAGKVLDSSAFSV
jgi:hypothetical protein